MMMVEAIVRVDKLEEVKKCMAGLGINGFTVSPCFGYGEEEGPKEEYRGRKYDSDLIEKNRTKHFIIKNWLKKINKIKNWLNKTKRKSQGQLPMKRYLREGPTA